MKTKVYDYQSLQLEKQRLKLLCIAQEKEMEENFTQLKTELNPSNLLKNAVLELIPSDIRENSIVKFLLSFVAGSNKGGEKSIGSELYTLAKTTLITAAITYLDKFLKKD